MTLAKPLYSRAELCDLFDQSPDGIDYLRKKKLIPEPVKIGRRLYWKADELEQFLDGLK
jgi:DNA-binding transcriptional MerR regulator